jgi:hypothetical protein
MKINQNDVPQEVWIPEHSQDPNNPLGRLEASLNAGSPVLDYIYTRNTARASRALSFLTKPWDNARCFLQAPPFVRLATTCEGQAENI